MAAWIEMISDDDASQELLDVLALARTPHGTVDNVMRVHSLRPNTMRGHVVLCQSALHDDILGAVDQCGGGVVIRIVDEFLARAIQYH